VENNFSPELFQQLLNKKKVITNLAGMVDYQHSEHSKADLSPNREAMLGQNISNFSKSSAR